MNRIFKKDTLIRLDDNYHLTDDGGNGVSLVFTEIRERKKKGSEETEEFEYSESLYFNRVNQALNRYVDLSLNKSTDLKELIERNSKIYEIISEFDIKFRQF